MADGTAIEWTDATFNPWVGCTKVSPGCDHCYAESWAKRAGQSALWDGERRHTKTWNDPVKWNREAEATGLRKRVFCASLADVFDNEVPVQWRNELWTLIDATPHLDWQLLTKRIGNVARMLPDGWGDGWPHVWLGESIVNQEEADRDIPKLLATPAVARFVSYEPALGPVDFRRIYLRDGWTIDALGGGLSTFGTRTNHQSRDRLDWVIVGGESGPKARPMHPDWPRSIRDQCEAAGVPFFFKQWGEFGPSWANPPPMTVVDGDEIYGLERVGKKAAGAVLDGIEYREFPSERSARP